MLETVCSNMPSSNGMVERTIGTIVDSLRCNYFENKDMKLFQLVNQTIRNYNQIYHKVTGFSPKELIDCIDEYIFFLNSST